MLVKGQALAASLKAAAAGNQKKRGVRLESCYGFASCCAGFDMEVVLM
jgi:hypothetical protein